MNKQLLEDYLKELISRYISDNSIRDNLTQNIEPSKVKYILAEIERNKTADYNSHDKNLIKDIYFYYC